MTRANQYKIVILGKTNAGKSKLLLRAIDNRYYETSYPDTTANCYRQNFMTKSGTQISLDLWDLAGNPSSESLNHQHIKNSHAVMICVEPNELSDANYIIESIKTLRQYQPHLPITIVITKSDLAIDLSLKNNLIYFAKQNKLKVAETSAKKGDNVRELFQNIADTVSSYHHDSLLNTNQPLLINLKNRIAQLTYHNQKDNAFQQALIQLHKQLEKQEKHDIFRSHAIAKATLMLLNDLDASTGDVQTLFQNYQNTCAPYHQKTPTIARLIGMVIITGFCALLGVGLGVGIGIAAGITAGALLYGTVVGTATAASIVGAAASSLFFFKPNAVQTALTTVIETGNPLKTSTY